MGSGTCARNFPLRFKNFSEIWQDVIEPTLLLHLTSLPGQRSGWAHYISLSYVLSPTRSESWVRANENVSAAINRLLINLPHLETLGVDTFLGAKLMLII